MGNLNYFFKRLLQCNSEMLMISKVGVNFLIRQLRRKLTKIKKKKIFIIIKYFLQGVVMLGQCNCVMLICVYCHIPRESILKFCHLTERRFFIFDSILEVLMLFKIFQGFNIVELTYEITKSESKRKNSEKFKFQNFFYYKICMRE